MSINESSRRWKGLDTIKQFVLEKYVPRIKDAEFITVGFGQPYKDAPYMYSLRICRDGSIWFKDNNHGDMMVNFSEPSMTPNGAKSIYLNRALADNLLFLWPEAKTSIEKALGDWGFDPLAQKLFDFTNKEAVHDALSQIRQYIKDNYVPRLSVMDSIVVKFGEMFYPAGEREPIHRNALRFDCDGRIWFTVGKMQDIPFDNGVFGCTLFDLWNEAGNLLRYWPQVKKLIEAEFENRAYQPEPLGKFEV